MATPDIVILIIIVTSAGIGFVRGLLRELLSLASWIAAFILALYFAPSIEEWFEGGISEKSVRLAIGFILIFAVTLIIGGIIQWLVRKLVETTGLTGTDRFLGFLFGSARGVLVCIIGLIAIRPFAADSDWWDDSDFAPALLEFERDVLELMGRAQDVFEKVNEGR